MNLSVILPTYKRDKILCNTLSQLLNQDPSPLEIIVIDQTKRHDFQTQMFLEELIRENKIRYIYQDSPHANMARNRGVKESKGDIVLILNDDIVIEKDLIYKHYINYKDKTIAAVSGQVLESKEEPTDRFPPQYYRKFTGWMYFPLNFSKRVEVINLNACNLSIRRETFIEAGGFDENFIKTYFDDTDLSIRVHRISLKRGFKTIHDPKAGLFHLKEPTLRGENRPSGINEYVIADSDAWLTWLYFFLINFGLCASWEILLRLRRCVFRKKNILKPCYLWKACLEFIIGMQKALELIKNGRKLGFSKGRYAQGLY